MLIISADRYVFGRVVDLDEGVLTEYLGGYCDYQAARAGRGERAGKTGGGPDGTRGYELLGR